MGELRRHAEIMAHCQEAMRKIRPEEDYTCLELGNYFTDVSQFRDPYAQMLGKREVWGQAMSDIPVLKFIPVVGIVASELILSLAVDLDEWIDQVFGVPEPADKRFGKLSQYFEHAVHGLTHLIFADNIPQQPYWEQQLRKKMGNHEPLPAAELERLWDKFYTQYYPHEHADFPPYVLYGEHRPNHRLYRIGSRHISNYLEEYIDTLAEELSKIEEAWKKDKNLVKSHPARHDILARLGNAMHCVEDYFFHSNYLELHLWNELRRGRPKTETEEQFRQFFVANVAKHYLPKVPSSDPTPDDRFEPSKTHQLRAHMRRLRYPLYLPVNTLDPEASESALPFLYTAGFDKKDLFHTMAGALEGIESAFERFDKKWQVLPDFLQKQWASQNPGQIRETELVLIKMLLSKEERTKMGRDEKLSLIHI